ncbi:hypothetical protein [Flavobacterium sp. LC2016-01]|uniref:hypothetical protein n=1 Tax=Flavobacterium sp. LC2016-01 TaxID=2675876 RepID=UPI0012BB07F9|nr:hypothetical protein [Flavobacterium sp. LC2016-01]MTH15041.1 hypothetical protein [Flavobacterium sp. LC2016-01]
MENRTEIGKAIKDQLSNLDKSPSSFVWSKIEKDLNQKRRKRILAWLIPSFVAIALLSSALYYNFSFQDNTQKQETPSHKEIQTQAPNSKSNESSVQNVKPNPKLQKSGPDEIITVKKTKSVKLVKESSKLVSTTNEYEEYEVVKKYKVVIKKEQITTTPIPLRIAKKPSKPSISKTDIIANKTTKTLNPTSKKTSKSKAKKQNKKSTTKPLISEKPENTTVIKDTLTQKKTEIVLEQTEIKKDTLPKIDSLQVKKPATAKREYVKKEYATKSKEANPDFSVHAFYGPAISGSINGSSMISPTMDNLPKSHPITSHYGIYAKTMYARFGFRTGFSKINLKTITQLDQNLITDFKNISLNTETNIKQTFGTSNEVELLQKISYYEIPLEFNYALKNDESKFDIDAFTGFSFLFLDKNDLYLKSEKIAKQKIGEAKNISGLNVSYDFGIGITYKLTEKIGLDINPLFKYYLNTFKENGEAKPYSLSLQTGINYKF